MRTRVGYRAVIGILVLLGTVIGTVLRIVTCATMALGISVSLFPIC